MSAGHVVSWIVCGLIVGLLARHVVSGPSLLKTAALSVAGAVVGGLLLALVAGFSREPLSLAGNAWYGWVAAAVGAALALWGYSVLFPKRWWQ